MKFGWRRHSNANSITLNFWLMLSNVWIHCNIDNNTFIHSFILFMIAVVVAKCEHIENNACSNSVAYRNIGKSKFKWLMKILWLPQNNAHAKITPVIVIIQYGLLLYIYCVVHGFVVDFGEMHLFMNWSDVSENSISKSKMEFTPISWKWHIHTKTHTHTY